MIMSIKFQAMYLNSQNDVEWLTTCNEVSYTYATGRL